MTCVERLKCHVSFVVYRGARHLDHRRRTEQRRLRGTAPDEDRRDRGGHVLLRDAVGARRRTRRKRWETIGQVEGSGTTSETQTYRFTDEELPYAADTLSYRLRQIDTDGSAHTTDPVTVARRGPRDVELLGTYPNPARQRVTVRFAIPEETEADAVQLRLYDVLGRRVRTVEATAEPGRHKRRLSVDGLASGVYFLRLRAGKILKTRKLTVVQ